MSFASRVGATVVSIGAIAHPAAAQCDPRWLPGDGMPGTDSPVRAVTTFDPDGPGPLARDLIIGGSFWQVAGPVNARGIARFDGAAWHAIGLGYINGAVSALGEFDPDGPGPANPELVAGGWFPAGLGVSPTIAAWNGSTWHGYGPGFSAGTASAFVAALAVHDPDGSGPELQRLIAGGQFLASGPTAVNAIAQWNGQAWLPLGSGLALSSSLAIVYAITSFDPDGVGPAPADLIAAGRFDSAGGMPASGIARWDGAAWHPLGSGLSGVQGAALAVADPDGLGPLAEQLIVGGFFDAAGGVNAPSVARWDGAAWHAMGDGLWIPQGSSTVWALGTFDPDGAGTLPATFLAAGQFSHSGTTEIRGIAAWDGAAWQPFATNPGTPLLPLSLYPYPYISAFTAFDPDASGLHPIELVAGGQFLEIGGAPAKHIAWWEGIDWNAMARGFDAEVYALAEFDLDGPGPEPAALVVGGEFTHTGGGPLSGIARFDDSGWGDIGGLGVAPSSTMVRALLPFDPDGSGPAEPRLVAGGWFDDPPGIQFATVVAWEKGDWSQLGSLWGEVYALADFDEDGPGPAPPRLIAGGYSLYQGFSCVVVWDGASWAPLGPLGWYNPAHGPPVVYAVRAFDPDGSGPQTPVLFAGGEFGFGGAIGFVRWNGATWESVLPGYPRVLVMEVFDPDGPGPIAARLFVGGEFGGPSIMAWDGTNWTPILTGLGADRRVRALTGFDPDGAGPAPSALIAGGNFESYQNVARWDGTTWSTLGTGLSIGQYPRVLALAAFDPDGPGPIERRLGAGGSFTGSGNVLSPYFAQWGCPPTCYPDCDTSGTLTPQDFACFQLSFVGGDPYADCNADGSLTVADFGCFQTRFVVGCP